MKKVLLYCFTSMNICLAGGDATITLTPINQSSAPNNMAPAPSTSMSTLEDIKRLEQEDIKRLEQKIKALEESPTKLGYYINNSTCHCFALCGCLYASDKGYGCYPWVHCGRSENENSETTCCCICTNKEHDSHSDTSYSCCNHSSNNCCKAAPECPSLNGCCEGFLSFFGSSNS